MEIEKTIIGAIFLAIGLVYAGFPGLQVKSQVWWFRRVLGAELIPSQKTFLVYRLFGVVCLVFGLALLLGTKF
ncbi:MAG: hypothetical protein A3A28_01275 [Candidatus Sungbacteria bacterium RIFCSPLOWO2_01_FULL_47_32]|uniref:DUF6199 domain-containing protein n=1 Tax=Candidatus Sungbacteria bacterium RIFCSPHIGHO2_01_FULL_47_32 TaxID=1802264 RepID=A0A1G2K8L7_9BACT|nr:MAG: hypothetical protein UX72_C0004G0052 [Parcubacteria group bacterium GW2011_GWA2_47_10]OGZ95766.1 MAG: hypothetical protein A2633_00530 [Candidatus Sungbacteria bacterium RIFCSPHIGHO2_01_FULL_47_32]OGZ99081.1 MAG: hypothetical protein A3D57_03455 [Candidatus Sungbacteria bacterium RIFCSPHIGHO2_02_FULL_46_12]OHA04573.1 MAG: hypothetical protein A3A28_01275 [Candidatus Sungbacteria bacterium RIFCSPLOWO2_01_FULL_47_32]